MTGGIALMMSAVVGGALADVFGFVPLYFMTGMLSALAIGVIMLFRDSHIQRDSAEVNIIHHMKGMVSAISGSKFLLLTACVVVLLTAVHNMTGEFYQLWYMSLNVPTSLFGIIGAVLFARYFLGALLARVLPSRGWAVILLSGLVIASGCMVMIQPWWILLTISAVAIGLSLQLTSDIQHRLPSRYRASISSLINAAGRLCIIPVFFAFGYVSSVHGVFAAGGIIVGLLVMSLYVELYRRLRQYEA